MECLLFVCHRRYFISSHKHYCFKKAIPQRWLKSETCPICARCYCCSVTRSCPALCDPMGCSTSGFPVLDYLWSLLKLMSIESVMPSNYLILCHPLFLLPSIFRSIRVSSRESALLIRWPKYWSFSISPICALDDSNRHSARKKKNFLLKQITLDWL